MGESSFQMAVSGQVDGLGSSADYSPASGGLGGLPPRISEVGLTGHDVGVGLFGRR